MRKTVLIAIFFCIAVIARSQNLIVSDSTYKAGIYKNFEEFKNNNPSIKFDYTVKTKEKGYGFLGAGGTVSLYRIEIDKKVGQSIGDVYGFSDGKNIYVNTHNPILHPKTEFFKIDLLGKYCYYQDYAYQSTGAQTITLMIERVIDINTGEEIILNKKEVRKILANDAALLTAFEMEDGKNKKLKDYIKKFNEKNK